MSHFSVRVALFLFGALLLPSAALAQISTDAHPLGLGKAGASHQPIATVQVANRPLTSKATRPGPTSPDRATLLPHTYGTRTDVAINLKTAATEHRLSDGGTLWQLRITASGARGLRLTYDRFRLPPGARFFVYDERGTVVRGAFTARNNAPHDGFATALTPGDRAVLEYYEPPDPAFAGEIRVASVVQATHRPYASAPLAGESYQASALSCSINTACPEGEPWSKEARATVLIDRGGSTCSGVLLNNTDEDFTPYILTAHHCGSPAVGDTLDWLVTFNYSSPSCSNPDTAPPAQSMTGVVVRAAGSGWREDYALLELINPIPASYDAYYAGWSLATAPPGSGVTLSHPHGDLRKIALDTDQLGDVGTRWVATFDHGTVEGGSSGAPLFNEAHQFVGHVRGAWYLDTEMCSGPDGDDNAATIIFPKLSHIWDAGAPGARVAAFLDPRRFESSQLEGLDSRTERPPVAQAWINEVDTRTADASEDDEAEFIELAGPAGLSLNGYQIEVYTCAEGTATLQTTEVIKTGSDATLVDQYQGLGFFVVSAGGLAGSTAHQRFVESNSNLLPDGHGLILLRDASGREVFDYQYDDIVDGTPVACPASRVTRSRADDMTSDEGLLQMRLLGDNQMKLVPSSTAIGFREQGPPTATSAGTVGIIPSPGHANEQPIPVELTRFDAVVDEGIVHLTWTTASEVHNAGFEIQTRNGEYTEAEWENIAFVEGAGTTNRTRHYHYRVSDLAVGRHTFRLRQVNVEGTSMLSPDVEVLVEATAPYRLTRPHPNPFRQQAALTLTVAQPQHVDVALYDILGRRVAKLHEGTVPADQSVSLRVDARSLPSGLYIVRAIGERFTASRRMTLLR